MVMRCDAVVCLYYCSCRQAMNKKRGLVLCQSLERRASGWLTEGEEVRDRDGESLIYLAFECRRWFSALVRNKCKTIWSDSRSSESG